MDCAYRRVRVDQAFTRKNPTMDDGIARADGELLSRPKGPVPKIRPMRIERLIAAGPPYTEEQQARILYHETQSAAEVARQLGRSIYWARTVLAWDLQQQQNKSA